MPSEETNPQEGNRRFPEKEDHDVDEQGRATNEIPDVTLEVPELSIEELSLQVENLRARISLQSELADTVRINVGVDAYLDNVELDVKGLKAQALLKANLETVRDILSRTLKSLDNNPDLLQGFAQMGTGSGGSLEGVAGSVQDDDSQRVQSEGQADPEDEEAETEEVNATEAAWRRARELGVDLSRIEGSGSNGRVIVKDVVGAARQG